MRALKSKNHHFDPQVALAVVAVILLVSVVVVPLTVGPRLKEHFFPQDIVSSDPRVVPLKDALANWEAELVDTTTWTVIPGYSPSGDAKTSNLDYPEHFRFSRPNTTDPAVDGWVSQKEANATRYFVQATWSRNWKPSFSTTEQFRTWAESKLPGGTLECDQEQPFKCEYKQYDFDNKGRNYTISFNALHSNDFLVDNKGPSLFLILRKEVNRL